MLRFIPTASSATTPSFTFPIRIKHAQPPLVEKLACDVRQQRLACKTG